MNHIDINEFQHDLISWFEAEQRDLPWRKDKDPYKVWVSEIMLQQTRVDTVIPYFHRFMEQFPTTKALAEAEEDRVLKAWEGLGYYSRARNLQAAVREVEEKYGGKVPDNLKEISSLKGIGPYTAGAVLSIAYGIPEPAVDGNVMRVLARILSIWDDIAKPSTRKIFEEAVRKLISHENPSFFNQALMELGALICTPTFPKCLLCPVREHCHAFHEGTIADLPVKTKNKKHRHVRIAAAVFTDEQGRILIHKRDENGLLANLWEYPNTEILLPYEHETTQLKEIMKEQYGADVEINEMNGQIEHVFSHLTWNINAYKGTLLSLEKETDNLKLVTLEEMEQYAFSVSHQKIFQQFFELM
ncbi:A/G-specific adenine glycosylase [Bacillus sp. S/N-304-OC-R1]|nr:A/G-specific adenine glycosylase [Bacillus sp. S/N-304-OC-R1]